MCLFNTILGQEGNKVNTQYIKLLLCDWEEDHSHENWHGFLKWRKWIL